MSPVGGGPVPVPRARRVWRRVSAAAVGAARAPWLSRPLRALGRYPPRPAVVAGTSRFVESYGPDPEQAGEWWFPPGAASGTDLLPTVMLVHGGYWRGGYDRSLEAAVAADLAGLGFLCWVPDYRPSTAPWPTTMADAAAAADHLVSSRFSARVDGTRLAFVGHSAGGHLALWLASRHRLPSGAPTQLAATARTLLPALVISQAGVAALTAAGAARLGGGASAELVGGSPEQVDDRYRVADPVRLLPTGIRSVLVHGAADDTVPIDQSEAYVAAAVAAGDDSTLVRVEPGEHMDHLVPSSAAGAALRAALRSLR